MEYETLNLDSIKMENPYLRLGTDVSTLERSIETIGLISPLIVNENNVLLAGARRWQALKNLGHEEAPIIRVTKDSLHQELISIDENLVRKSLSTPEVEKHLLRAKEIYREMAETNDEFKEELMAKRKKRQSEAENAGETISEEAEMSLEEVAADEFAEDVSIKSGLSKNQVLKAMEREQKSSQALREARERGDLNVSQTNELIRLEEEDQEALIPHIEGRTVSELRKLVKEAKSQGVATALENNQKEPHARDYAELLKSFKKAYKIMEKLSYENITIQGPMKKDLQRYWEELSLKSSELFGSAVGEENEAFHPEYLNQDSPESTAPLS